MLPAVGQMWLYNVGVKSSNTRTVTVEENCTAEEVTISFMVTLSDSIIRGQWINGCLALCFRIQPRCYLGSVSTRSPLKLNKACHEIV